MDVVKSEEAREELWARHVLQLLEDNALKEGSTFAQGKDTQNFIAGGLQSKVRFIFAVFSMASVFSLDKEQKLKLRQDIFLMVSQ